MESIALLIVVLIALLFAALMFVAGIWVFQWGFRYGRSSAFEDKNNLPPKAVVPSPEGMSPDQQAAVKQFQRVLGQFDEPQAGGR